MKPQIRTAIWLGLAWLVVAIGVAVVWVSAGCIDHDLDILHHQIRKCTEKTFMVPLDDWKQRLEADDDGDE